MRHEINSKKLWQDLNNHQANERKNGRRRSSSNDYRTWRDLSAFHDLQQHLFASKYETSKEYEALTTLTIAQAVNTVAKADYHVTIVIDGLSAASRQRVTRDLRKLKITYDKVVGGREQSSALLRLADALAGLMRDFWEGQPYAIDCYRNLIQNGLLVDLHK